MSDRLTELQRQRALIQGHLAWLDREIAEVANEPSSASSQSPGSFQPSTPSAATAPVPTTAPLTANRDADELIAKFGSDTKDTTQSARRGCFIVFGALLVPILGFLAYMIYLSFRGRG